MRVESENVRTGEMIHTSTAYLTMVALDDEGMPDRVPPVAPETPDEVSARPRGAAAPRHAAGGAAADRGGAGGAEASAGRAGSGRIVRQLAPRRELALRIV